MREVSEELGQKYKGLLGDVQIPQRERWQFQKWLRFYLDFCGKYQFAPDDKKSLPQFLKKLEEKRQTADQKLQASKAIELYFRLLTAFPTQANEKRTPLKYTRPFLQGRSPSPRGNQRANLETVLHNRLETFSHKAPKCFAGISGCKNAGLKQCNSEGFFSEVKPEGIPDFPPLETGKS